MGHEVALQVGVGHEVALKVELVPEVVLQALKSCDMSSRTSRGAARGGFTSGEQLGYEQQNE